MSVYMTEAEQIEAIKKWWYRYNNLIIMVLAVVALVMSGYKYWNWHQNKITQQASNAYEHMIVAFSNQDIKSVRGYANQLLTDYRGTVYADVARLTLAKLYVTRDKYAQAEDQLKNVATNSKMLALQQIAKIRLARLLTAEKSYDKALLTLNSVENTIYVPEVNELKGDIYAAMGQYANAVNFYRKASSEVKTHGMGNLFLEMKTNELVALTRSADVTKKSQTA